MSGIERNYGGGLGVANFYEGKTALFFAKGELSSDAVIVIELGDIHGKCSGGEGLFILINCGDRPLLPVCRLHELQGLNIVLKIQR